MATTARSSNIKTRRRTRVLPEMSAVGSQKKEHNQTLGDSDISRAESLEIEDEPTEDEYRALRK